MRTKKKQQTETTKTTSNTNKKGANMIGRILRDTGAESVGYKGNSRQTIGGNIERQQTKTKEAQTQKENNRKKQQNKRLEGFSGISGLSLSGIGRTRKKKEKTQTTYKRTNNNKRNAKTTTKHDWRDSRGYWG